MLTDCVAPEPSFWEQNFLLKIVKGFFFNDSCANVWLICVLLFLCLLLLQVLLMMSDGSLLLTTIICIHIATFLPVAARTWWPTMKLKSIVIHPGLLIHNLPLLPLPPSWSILNWRISYGQKLEKLQNCSKKRESTEDCQIELNIVKTTRSWYASDDEETCANVYFPRLIIYHPTMSNCPFHILFNSMHRCAFNHRSQTGRDEHSCSCFTRET